MKNHLIFALLSLTCTHHTTFTMENWDTEDQAIELKSIDQPTQTSPDLDEIISIIDAAINKKYVTKSSWTGNEYQVDGSTLTEKDFFDIMDIIDQHVVQRDANTMENLFPLWKNKYFNRAHEHFSLLAKKNIDKVTSDNVETILDPNISQPISQLNKLYPYIAQYFMNYAYHWEIDCSYNITLTGHTDVISCFDIEPSYHHHAATSSYDKTLRLWDLTTGKCVHIFPGDDNTAHCICFDKVSLHRLATAFNHKDQHNKSTIKIWNTESAQLLHNKEVWVRDKIDSLSYAGETLITWHKTQTAPEIRIFVIDEKGIHQGNCITVSYNLSPFGTTLIWGKLYETKAPNHPQVTLESTLTIRKLKGPDFYIYERAIKNDPLKMNGLKIDASPCTDYEKDLLRKLLSTEQKRKLTQK